MVIMCRLVDMDEHWMPITNYCGICAVHYDYIIKYENFATEMPFLWKKLGHSVSEERWSSPGKDFISKILYLGIKTYFLM